MMNFLVMHSPSSATGVLRNACINAHHFEASMARGAQSESKDVKSCQKLKALNLAFVRLHVKFRVQVRG